MKKNYVTIPIIIISIIAIIVIINIKERRKGNQVNTNNIIINNTEKEFNNTQEVTDIITTEYKGKTIQITEQNDIDTIKNILLNSKFDDWSTDSVSYFVITLNNEEYYFNNQGRTVTKGGEKEEYLSEKDTNKILNILNKYINKYFKEEKENTNKILNILDNIYYIN